MQMFWGTIAKLLKEVWPMQTFQEIIEETFSEEVGQIQMFWGLIAKTVSEEVGQMQFFWEVIAKTFLEEVRLMQTFQGDTANLLRGGVADGYFSEGGQIKRHVNCSGGRGHTLNILGGR